MPCTCPVYDHDALSYAAYLSSEHSGEWDSGVKGGCGGFPERSGELNTTLAATSINNTGGGEFPW